LQAHAVALDIEEFITRKQPRDLADEDVAARGLDRLAQPAFESHRRLDDIGRLYCLRGRMRETHALQFADTGRHVVAAVVYLQGHWLIGDVDDEFPVGENVLGCVFQPALLEPVDTDHQD
jgi:hypothetical protein